MGWAHMCGEQKKSNNKEPVSENKKTMKWGKYNCNMKSKRFWLCFTKFVVVVLRIL